MGKRILLSPLLILTITVCRAQDNNVVPSSPASNISNKDHIIWVVKDEEVRYQFIKEFIDRARNTDNRNLTKGVQSHHLLYVTYDKSAKKIVNIDTKAEKDPTFNTLDLNFIRENMSDELISHLKNRKYKWDDINASIGNYQVGKDVISVFKEVNYKNNRDVFWWSYHPYDLGLPNMRHVVRKFEYIGFVFEQGFSETGFPNNFSNSANIGVANEIIKGYVTIPFTPLVRIGNYHPLEGTFGTGIKFDTYNFGGFMGMQDMSWQSLEDANFYADSSTVYMNSYAGLYVTNTFDVDIFNKDASIRMKWGPVYSQFVYGKKKIKNNEYIFVENDRTSIMESANISVRTEIISALEKDTYRNEWRIAAQFLVNPRMNIKFLIYTGYEPINNVRIGLTYAWSGKYDFEWVDNQGSKKAWTWNPGYIICPELTIVF